MAHLYPLLLSTARGMKMGFSVSKTPTGMGNARVSGNKPKAPARKGNARLSGNMYQCPSGYIFRLKIPLDLKPIVGKTEFRYSLRTGSLRIAKQRTRCISAYLQQLFMTLRTDMTELTQEQINQMVQQYIRETLANDEKCRAISNPLTSAPRRFVWI